MHRGGHRSYSQPIHDVFKRIHSETEETIKDIFGQCQNIWFSGREVEGHYEKRKA